jgi:hypothetical protein
LIEKKIFKDNTCTVKKSVLAWVIFKEKKSTIFSIILRQLEKWENYKKISYQKALVVL